MRGEEAAPVVSIRDHATAAASAPSIAPRAGSSGGRIWLPRGTGRSRWGDVMEDGDEPINAGEKFWLSDDDSDDSVDDAAEEASDASDDSGDAYERDDVDVAAGVGNRLARMRATRAEAMRARGALAQGGSGGVGTTADDKKSARKSAASTSAEGNDGMQVDLLPGGGKGDEVGAAEEMFFEEGADDADQAWANEARGGRVSDAILSCPCCLEIVTIDCQVGLRREPPSSGRQLCTAVHTRHAC